jgi:hypothetical protein
VLGFSVFTFDGYAISLYRGNDLFIQNTQVGAFVSATMTTSNGIYGELDNYIFALTPTNAIDSNCII